MNKFYAWYIRELEAHAIKEQADKRAEEQGIERYADNG